MVLASFAGKNCISYVLVIIGLDKVKSLLKVINKVSQVGYFMYVVDSNFKSLS